MAKKSRSRSSGSPKSRSGIHATRGEYVRTRSKEKIPGWVLAVGGAAVIGGIVAMSRNASATPSQPAPLPEPLPTPTVTPVQRFEPPPPSGYQPDQLVIRLRGSDLARQIFAFQSLMYSFNKTDHPPDGVIGPVTRQLVLDINTAGSFPGGNSFSNRMYERAQSVILRERGLSARPERLIPMRLPADVIQSVNMTILRDFPNAILLQALSST